MNVAELFRSAAERHATRAAFVAPQPNSVVQRITFGELWDDVARFSSFLRHRGIANGDRAIVMVPMSVDLYVTLLGVLAAGAVAVFVDPWVGPRAIARLATSSRPRVWIGSPKSHLLRLLESPLRRIPLGISTGARLPFLINATLRDALTTNPDTPLQPVDDDTPALITFTTGSSGNPKGAHRSHRILAAQHRALASEFPAREGDVDLTNFPVFALNNLALGVTTVIPPVDLRRIDAADPELLARAVHEHGVTTISASPPIIDALARAKTRVTPRRILTGGAPVSDAQLHRWRDAFPDAELGVVYGSTEAEPVAHVSAEERLAERGSRGYLAGHPTSVVRTRVIRITDEPIEIASTDAWKYVERAPGEVGELIVAGEHVCTTYEGDDEAMRRTKIRDVDGIVWHRMGDTGWFDEFGRFRLAGRVHSTIRRGGAEIHPQLVEQAAIGDDPTIRRAAAVGLPDSALGSRVVVVIESRDASAASRVESRLRDAEQFFDDVIVTAEPLPVDPRHNSKINYAALRERLERTR